MHNRWFVGLLASVAVLGSAASAPSAHAQSVGNMLKDDFTNAGKDVLGVWAAPFRADARDWGTFALAMGAFGVSMLADDAVSDWAIRNDSAGNLRVLDPARRGGVLFTGKYVVPPIAALYVAGIVFKNQDMRDALMGCAATWIAQSPPRRQLAKIFGRARPDTTKDDPNTTIPRDPHIWEIGYQDRWVMRSFPGGHIANVMGCATFWAKRFDLGIAEPLLYGVAGAVGVGRMADGAHWFSDQLIGGVLGYAIGSEVARRSLSRVNGPAVMQSSSLSINPGLDGVNVTWRWTF
jgi:membrane-associated phospholipid phosphatase